MVKDEHIEVILNTGSNVKDIAKRLVNAALAAGGRDNVSVMICKV